MQFNFPFDIYFLGMDVENKDPLTHISTSFSFQQNKVQKSAKLLPLAGTFRILCSLLCFSSGPLLILLLHNQITDLINC